MCISKQQVSSQKNKEVVFTKQIIHTISTGLRLKRCPMSWADPNAVHWGPSFRIRTKPTKNPFTSFAPSRFNIFFVFQSSRYGNMKPRLLPFPLAKQAVNIKFVKIQDLTLLGSRLRGVRGNPHSYRDPLHNLIYVPKFS